MFARHKRKKVEDQEVEANLIPVLSCLFLLIPALLLAMEVAPFTSVRVDSPRFSDLTPGDPKPRKEELKLRIHVREDGFVAKFAGSREAPDQSVDIPMTAEGEHDFAALEAKARDLKVLFPEDTSVTLSAEGTIEYQTLVRSMDALRGQECSLAGTFVGEEVPPECYFWQVVVQSGAA